jgi:hypothetical protein
MSGMIRGLFSPKHSTTVECCPVKGQVVWSTTFPKFVVYLSFLLAGKETHDPIEAFDVIVFSFKNLLTVKDFKKR